MKKKRDNLKNQSKQTDFASSLSNAIERKKDKSIDNSQDLSIREKVLNVREGFYRLGKVSKELKFSVETLSFVLNLRGFKTEPNPDAVITEKEYKILRGAQKTQGNVKKSVKIKRVNEVKKIVKKSKYIRGKNYNDKTSNSIWLKSFGGRPESNRRKF